MNELKRRRQKSVVFAGLLFFQIVLFLIQLWLFVMVLENLLAGEIHMVEEATIASLGMLALNIWMLLGINRLVRMK